MKKVVIFCGQELSTEKVLTKANKEEVNIAVSYVTDFPEAFYGAKEVRKNVLDAIQRFGHNTFMTRYSTILNKIGDMIEVKLINPEEVQIFLYNQGKWSEHGYDQEGYVREGWPYGVLE